MTPATFPAPRDPGPRDPDRPGLQHVPRLVETFEHTWREEAASSDGDDLPSLLARVAARVLRVDGAALSIEVAPGSRVPLGASDARSAIAERLQFTAGEGPCFEALAEGRPITVTEEAMRQRWPVLAVLHQQATPFRGGMSVPLREGATRFGVLDLYLTDPRPLRGQDVVAAQLIAQATADVLLDVLAGVTSPVDADSGDTEPPGDWFDTTAVRGRREVWVAVGMADLTLGLRHDDALATLRAHAVEHGQSLDAFSHDVVTGRVDLEALHGSALPDA